MLTVGVAPDAITANSLVHARTCGGDVAGAQQLATRILAGVSYLDLHTTEVL